MKFFVDESVDGPVVIRLRTDGHQAHYIAESSPSLGDERILEAALEQDAVVLTADKDFGELVFRDGRLSAGVVLIRLEGYVPEQKAIRVLDAIRAHGEQMPRSFTVVTANQVKIRPLAKLFKENVE